MKALDVLRSELEESMYLEHPPPKSTTYTFYGKDGSSPTFPIQRQNQT
jgi:hypothetical protein